MKWKQQKSGDVTYFDVLMFTLFVFTVALVLWREGYLSW